jgi:hypothetical protein
LIKIVKATFGEDLQVERVETDPELLVFIIKNSSFCLSKAFGLF